MSKLVGEMVIVEMEMVEECLLLVVVEEYLLLMVEELCLMVGWLVATSSQDERTCSGFHPLVQRLWYDYGCNKGMCLHGLQASSMGRDCRLEGCWVVVRNEHQVE